MPTDGTGLADGQDQPSDTDPDDPLQPEPAEIHLDLSNDAFNINPGQASPHVLPPPLDTHMRGILPFNPPPEPEPANLTPYTHLLSLHESLRAEVSRISTALTDLDGRHSMMILNENLRLKEELAYLGGQVGGLGRQVGWLTSRRLEDEGRSGTAIRRPGMMPGPTVAASAALEDGEGSALNAAPRRRLTDEGRVKL
ncbi:hypothetical protein CAC42_6281 [Sphaceloma murrayae]|uniref:Uncharacterized protein n=1 Tax=Sphaceloma murrayae TaxID=2082308 RepID=A0A2K1QTS1_9PEZI|nr:hypothetical protein CAC42_6281 [Sphaceloma murrayae]